MNAQPTSQLASHSVLAAGERVAQSELRDRWDSPEIQRILFAARQRFGHALCACRPAPLKLQIRLRDDKCHLAVWPHEHPAHDSQCIFFHDEVAESASAMAALRAAAASARTPAPAPTTDPPPTERPRIPLWTANRAREAPGAAPVSIKALSLRLWEAASLCQWHPDWSRDWGRTRYQLRQAAAEFTLNGRPLEQLLFVPRPYREAIAGALNQEWASFLRSLHVDATLGPRLLIAPVRRLIPPGSQDPAAMLLRHLSGPVGLTPACHDFMTRDCRNALSNGRVGGMQRAAASGREESAAAPRLPELVGFFFVERNSRGGLCARAGWLMAVHPSTYIPAANSNIVLLIDALVGGRYAFQHLISDVQASRRTAPDLLLRHVRGPDGVPVARAALEVLSPSVSAEYLAARAAIAASMAKKGLPTWVWTPVGRLEERQVPLLPPKDHVPPDAAARVLQEIFSSPFADYRYGFSSEFTIPSALRRPAHC